MTLKEAQTYFRYEDGVLYWKDHWSPSHRNGKLVGASWDPKRRKYACMISIQGKYKHLGRFNTAEEAHARYMQVARENGLL